MDTAAVTSEKRNFKMDTFKKVSKWNLGPHTFFLALSMGFFLCVISSLILVTTLVNYAVTYETRDLIEKLVVGENYFSAGPEITTTEIISSSGATGNGDNASTSRTTSETFSSTITTDDEFTKETSSTTTSGESFTSTTEISDNGNVTTTYQPEPVLKNPVSILNELGHQTGANYSCTQTCLSPSIFQAQLQLRLSLAKDNFLRLSHSVQTEDARVAKAYMAYLALNYLYKDSVNQSHVEEDWLKKIDNCEEKVDEPRLMPNCKL